MSKQNEVVMMYMPRGPVPTGNDHPPARCGKWIWEDGSEVPCTNTATLHVLAGGTRWTACPEHEDYLLSKDADDCHDIGETCLLAVSRWAGDECVIDDDLWAAAEAAIAKAAENANSRAVSA